ncbi:hypothetical protein EI534_10065 [Pseudomonas frederiksbergensis]|nr:hypothetical protein [Pseudomonas frederiksbergensis]
MGGLRPCRVPFPGRPTRVRFATLLLGRAQASVMASDFAGYLEGPHRHTAMAIQQIVMLAELAVNRMLDNVGVPKPAPHS